MLSENFPLTEAALNKLINGGRVEFYLYTPRSRTGMRTWELKIKNIDNSRKMIVIRDYGFEIKTETIKVHPFKTRAERNAEILRLYSEENLSQSFLADFFGISQPSVSLIVNSKENRMKIKTD